LSKLIDTQNPSSRSTSPPQLPAVQPVANPPVPASAKLSIPPSSSTPTPSSTSTPASPIPDIHPEEVDHYEVSYGPNHSPPHVDSPNIPVSIDTSQPSRSESPAFRRSAPPVPPKAFTVPPSGPAVSLPVQEPADFTNSVKALRDRFNQPTNPSNASSSSDQRVQRVIAPNEAAKEDVAPQPPQVVRQEPESLPVLYGVESSGEPVQPVESAVQNAAAVVERTRSKPPPPPPPISRTASPAPIPVDRSTKLAISANLSLPDQPATRVIDPSDISNVITTSGQVAKPPPIPIRKPTAAVPFEVPNGQPPTPSSRPLAQSPSSTSLSSSLESSAIPPRLPDRSRAQSITRADEPPRLPVRSATISLSKNLAASSRRLPSSRSRDLSPPPQIYQPLPPPTRAPNNNFASPPRREREESRSTPAVPATNDEISSENEDDDDATPISGLTPTARRMLEDYPDSTHANRRPPSFVPDLNITNMHHVNCHAIFGRYICLGAHHVRVYDTLISDRPVLTVELRDTGLEFRMKDPKITAMSFRPPGMGNEVDEGRYLWCGTKDGHLWELDVKSGVITDTKSFIHASAVTHILRYGQFILTIEEGGKMNVFEVQQRDDDGRIMWIPMLIRSVRIAERFSYPRLIHGRLWTAAPPAVRSTTNTSSKGPTIRVYEPCTREVMPPSRTVFTSEWTGSVTAATVIPFRKGEVYLGHEGGFVSIWDEENLDCLRVVKVSGTDVTALEGVGGKLWAGNRKGQVWVYEVEGRPWSATNIWMAHGSVPLLVLLKSDY
jgi:hypothetical protein